MLTVSLNGVSGLSAGTEHCDTGPQTGRSDGLVPHRPTPWHPYLEPGSMQQTEAGALQLPPTMLAVEQQNTPCTRSPYGC